MLLLTIVLTALATLVNVVFWRKLAPDALGELIGHQRATLPAAPVSIIVAVRNEAANLPALLESLLTQQYPSYEVVVCDDGSMDGSADILMEWSAQYPKLRCVASPDPMHPGKKLALTTAIKAARYDWLCATDGDCVPASDRWLAQMMAARRRGTEVVLGYAPYRKEEGLLNRWIRFETLYTAAQYLSAALAGHPYMGVGRNLLFARQAFERVGGYTAHAHLPAGDDDLLVQHIATAANTALCVAPKAWVYSEAAPTWRAYAQQKRRHLSVGSAYRWPYQLALGALALSHVLHYLGVVLLLLQGSVLWAFGLLFVRYVVVERARRRLGRWFREGDTSRYYPVDRLDALLALYYAFGALSLWPKRAAQPW